MGHDRFVGVQAYQQLGEVYRALRLYVNCFQPSMKLQGKQYDGRKVHLIYDGAKTPLQRLQRSTVLPNSKEQALMQVFHALDPVRLLQQVKEVQQALFVHGRSASHSSEETAAIPLRRFCVERCLTGPSALDAFTTGMGDEQQEEADEPPLTRSLLEWHRTCNDPFKEVWELIASWVLAHPKRSSGEIFRELQRLFPDRYQPSHLRTLQRGVRKIRTRLGATVEMHWQEEVIHGDVPDLAFPGQQKTGETSAPVQTCALAPAGDPCQEHTQGPVFPSQSSTREEMTRPVGMTSRAGMQATSVPHLEPPQAGETSRLSGRDMRSHQRRSSLTIERAIQDYLEFQISFCFPFRTSGRGILNGPGTAHTLLHTTPYWCIFTVDRICSIQCPMLSTNTLCATS